MEAVATKNIDTFLDHFDGHDSVLPRHLVDQAKSALTVTDFPTRKTEAWKYTPVGKIARGKFSFQEKQVELPESLTGISQRLVFINGIFNESLSNFKTVDGLMIKSISESQSDLLGKNIKLQQEPFHVINTLTCQGGLEIHVKAGKKIEEPVFIIHLTSGEGTAAVNRHFIHVEKSAHAKFVQIFTDVDAQKSLSSVITEAFVEDNARLEIDKVQNESESNYHISTEQVSQGRDSQFDILTFTLNGALVRNNLNIDVEGQNCETNLSGAYLGKGKQHIDNNTVVDHKVANCESNELYKGVMGEKSTGVFNGKVFVRQDAQKINAFQSNKNVLLSEDASVNSKPELEIYADDVKCSHGSTTGQMDEEAVFYLMARGLSEKSARNLMVKAFIGELVDRLEDEFLVNYISDAIEERFGWGFKEEI